MVSPQILYEDDDILVLNKPSGLVVNRSATVKEPTLQDWVEKKIKNQKSKIKDGEGGPDFVGRAGIVHRLDKETSGVLLVAKAPGVFLDLQSQFKQRRVKKEYLALVHGEVVPLRGEIRTPIKRDPRRRERFAVIRGGRMATTYYRVISYFLSSPAGCDTRGYTLLELKPLTGRTHQIRVHLKHLGYPVVADSLYGGRRRSREDRQWCPRLFLHAFSLGFFHPESKAWLRVEAPLPLELKKALDLLLSPSR